MIYLTSPYSEEPCGFSPNHIASAIPTRNGLTKIVYKGGGGYDLVTEPSSKVLAMIEEAKQQREQREEKI